MRKSIIIGLIIGLGVALLALSGAVVSCVPEEGEEGEELVHLVYGGPEPGGGPYLFAVALAGAINRPETGLFLTLTEIGGGMAVQAELAKPESPVDMGVTSLGESYRQVRGESKWEGKQYTGIRFLLLRDIGVARIYARADSGCKTFGDLVGKPFNPGSVGTVMSARNQDYAEVCGYDINWVEGTKADATDWLREGKVVAVTEFGGLDSFTPGMMEVNITIPLTVLRYTDEEKTKIEEARPFPISTMGKTPAGAIGELPELGAIWEVHSPVPVVCTDRLPQQVGYDFVKFAHAAWDSVGGAYRSAGLIDPVETLINVCKRLPQEQEMYLHAGLVQYAKEMGIEVPDFLIPPEYKK